MAHQLTEPPHICKLPQAQIYLTTLRMLLRRKRSRHNTALAPKPRAASHMRPMLYQWPTQSFTQQQVPTWNKEASSQMMKYSLHGTVQLQMNLADWPRELEDAVKGPIQYYVFPAHGKNRDLWKICLRCAAKQRGITSFQIDSGRKSHQVRRRHLYQISRPHHVQMHVEQCNLNGRVQI
jgi:hypothetical protein